MGRPAELCSPPSLSEAPALTMPGAATAPHCCLLITGDGVSSPQEQLPSVGGASHGWVPTGLPFGLGTKCWKIRCGTAFCASWYV